LYLLTSNIAQFREDFSVSRRRPSVPLARHARWYETCYQASQNRKQGEVMKIFIGLLLVGVRALADQAPDSGQGKPVVIQDGPPAQAYIETALYQYLHKPPYLFIHAETPFFAKHLAAKNVWIALVDFYCGLNEQERLHCVTVLVFDPLTNEHRFMTPEQLAHVNNESAI
jgi:hypothetical protein